MYKEYKFEKTLKTMIKRNGALHLTNYGDDVCVDLALLDDPELHLTDEEKDAIIASIVRYHIFHDRVGVFFVMLDKFHSINVRGKFVQHKVYNAKTGRRRYLIAELVAVQLFIGTRPDVWSEYTTECRVARTGHGERAEDVEI